MGGTSSTLNLSNKSSHTQGSNKNPKEVSRVVMPIYFTEDDVSEDERKLAVDSWQLILDEKASEYLEKKQDLSFPYQSACTFFYDSFYVRLFDVHPDCRHLFRKGIKSQGRLLMKLISLCLAQIIDPKINKILTDIATSHFHFGVHAVEYGILGEVLFWALKHCLGFKAYSPRVHNAWVKVYSRMLRTIVPIAVGFELQSDEVDPIHRVTSRDTTSLTTTTLPFLELYRSLESSSPEEDPTHLQSEVLLRQFEKQKSKEI